MVEAGKDATKYGLYSKQGFRTIDTCDYIDKQILPVSEGMYTVTDGQKSPRQIEL